jgi:cyclophilin family peptidyl-prolyl cis-trans isomerase
VPSEKRARQRAARESRLALQAKAKKRRQQTRNTIIVVVVAAVIIGIVFLVSGNNSPKKKQASSTTTTLVGTTTTSAAGATTTTAANSANATAQAAANKLATAAGCPASTTAPANTQKYTAAPPMTINTGMLYSATVETTAGTFTMSLYAKAAPQTVNSFVFLANKGFYNCNIFHRVIPGFVDQTGDPTGTGSGPFGYKIPLENVPTAYADGEVAMASSQATGIGSQWFVLAAGGAQGLDADIASGGYSLFGKILTGADVVAKINGEGTQAGTPAVTERILKVTISESAPLGS